MPTSKGKKPRRRGNTENMELKNSGAQLLRDKGISTTLTLLDLRGSVPVTGPQDLDAIRKQVTKNIARKRGTGDSK
jgi:hypothetical protein